MPDLDDNSYLAGAIASDRVEANPDDAAEAVRLGSMSGIPPEAINDNLEDFRNRFKAGMAGDLVRNNPALTSYVAAHPFAANISNDDWANLDKFTRAAQPGAQIFRMLNAPEEVMKSAVDEGYEGFAEGMGQGMPLTAKYGMGWYPLELSGKLLSAVGGGIVGLAHGAAKASASIAGADANDSERFATDIAGMAEYQMTKGEMTPEGWSAANQIVDHQKWLKTMSPETAKALELAKPWADQGLEPPRGVHPILDDMKADTNAAWLDQFQDDLKNAQSSTTKERSPDAFARLVDQMNYGGAEVGIHGDAAAALYGDKVPAPDDGLLGWVPGIQDKLDLARSTGADVHVPVADWLAKMDPAIAKGLHDDIRMWPGGITAREAQDPFEPKAVVDSPLAQVRGASGLEPLFAIGDRKLSLRRVASWEDWTSLNDTSDFSPEVLERYKDVVNEALADTTTHQIAIMDDKGAAVGHINVTPENKDLYINYIESLSDHGPNSFGPSLIMDVKRQLKALFPDIDTISGLRVSGARAEPEHVSVKLSQGLEGLDKTRDIMAGAWRKMQPGVEANIPKEFAEPLQRLSMGIDTELRKSLGSGVDIQPTLGVRASVVGEGLRARGVFLQYQKSMPAILYDLLGPDPRGVARHEGIHYLRQYGFFTPEEWKTLTEAAKSEDWIGRYNIQGRYGHLSEDVQLEEAVAEGYREWASAGKPQTQGPVTQFFQKLADLWDRIKSLFTGTQNWEQIFKQIQEGRMAGREHTPLHEAAWRPAFSLDHDFENLQTNATGLDKRSWDNLQKQIQDRYAKDLEAAQARAEKEQKKTQTKEWKSNRQVIAKEVEANIRQRPDVAADLFIGSGEFYGRKLDKARYSLRASDLTPEQKAVIPRHYRSIDGLPIDDVARLFGYGSGDAMVEKLGEYNATKGDLTAQQMLRKTIEDETDRQMEQKYGQLSENIMDEAKDQALSEANLNILADEYHGAGMLAGKPTIDKDVIKAEVTRKIKAQPQGSISSAEFMREMNRHDRDAQRSLIAGKPADALKSLERRVYNGFAAAEARKLEKDRASFDKVAKRLAKREIPSMLPDYHNYIRQILTQIGKPIQGVNDLALRIEGRTGQTLQEFVAAKSAELREIPVLPDLYNPQWQKPYKDLTVAEFRAISDTVKSLAFHGRDEMKIYRVDEAADLAGLKQQIIAELGRFADLKFKGAGGERSMGPIPAKIAKVIRTYGYAHLQLENLLHRMDDFNSDGPLMQYVMRGLVEGANREDVWRRDYSKRLSAMGDKLDMKKTIDNQIWKNPDTKTLFEMNRGNLRAVMLNLGTNLDKLAGGYDLTRAQVLGWVDQHATKEDWDFVQRVWSEIFEDIKDKSDTMYRSLTGGVEAETIPGQKLQTQFGLVDGKYYPIIHHDNFRGPSKKLAGDALAEENYVRAPIPNGYTKSRTGDTKTPISLDLDMLPGRISQMLHDISLRPAIINASKVLLDKDIQSAMAAKFGYEMRDMLLPYLRSVANSANYESKAQSVMKQVGEGLRQNMIMTLVGANVGTVLKHGPTAFIQSMAEVGPAELLEAYRTLFSINDATGERNYQFAMQNSEELQRRHQNYEETLTGATQKLMPSGKFDSLRSNIIKYASYPVALSDKISAVPLWLARYEKAITDGETHGDAVHKADFAVRRAHGSTAITNQPAIMRDGNRWFTSVYTFFNHIMNRQAELMWRSGDMLKMLGGADKIAAMEKVPALSGQLFAYVIAPAIIEQYVSPIDWKEDTPWIKKAGLSLGYSLASSWVFARDMAHALIGGQDPQAGLISTALTTGVNIFHDLRKNEPFSEEHARTMLQHGAAFAGLLSGAVPLAPVKAGTFALGVAEGQEHPQGPWGWATGLRYGTLKKHSSTVGNYMENKPW